MVLYQWLHKDRVKFRKKLGIGKNNAFITVYDTVVTFIIVTFAWIFFRANTMSDAMLIIGNLFDFSAGRTVNLFRFPADFTIAFISIGLLLLIEILEEYNGLQGKLRIAVKPVKWAILAALVLSVCILGKWNEADFLYFQF